MPKQILQPKSLWVPKAPYSHGVKRGKLIFTAGEDARDAGGKLIGIGDVAAQTEQCLKNLRAVLSEAGAALDDVVKCTVFLADIRDFEKMNEVYRRFFTAEKPARSTVQARLALPEMLVEIEAVVVLDQ